MNLANQITIFRVILIPVFLVILQSNFFDPDTTKLVSLIIFVVASLTDALDGYIARSRNLITNFGKFMDPLADKLLVCAALISFVEIGLLPSWVVILIISREFIVTGFRLVAVSDNIVIAASSSAKLKTIFQMILVIWILIPFKFEFYDLITNFLIIITVVLTIVSAVEYIYKNKQVLK